MINIIKKEIDVEEYNSNQARELRGKIQMNKLKSLSKN